MTRGGVPVRTRPALTVGPLLVAALLSWAVVAVWMDGMPSGPGADPGSLGIFTAVWAVMMAAMMLPSAWPTVLVYQRLQAARRERGEAPVLAGPALLLLGYLATRTVAGVVGFVVVKAGRAVDVGALHWERGGPLLAGGMIAAAAVYQLTPLKDVCLARSASRSSTGARARSGRCGWVRGTACGASGVAGHLMAALFALGVLSISWMVLITLLIAVEKLLPWRWVGIAAVTWCC